MAAELRYVCADAMGKSARTDAGRTEPAGVSSAKPTRGAAAIAAALIRNRRLSIVMLPPPPLLLIRHHPESQHVFERVISLVTCILEQLITIVPVQRKCQRPWPREHLW